MECSRFNSLIFFLSTQRKVLEERGECAAAVKALDHLVDELRLVTRTSPPLDQKKCISIWEDDLWRNHY